MSVAVDTSLDFLLNLSGRHVCGSPWGQCHRPLLCNTDSIIWIIYYLISHFWIIWTLSYFFNVSMNRDFDSFVLNIDWSLVLLEFVCNQQVGGNWFRPKIFFFFIKFSTCMVIICICMNLYKISCWGFTVYTCINRGFLHTFEQEKMILAPCSYKKYINFKYRTIRVCKRQYKIWLNGNFVLMLEIHCFSCLSNILMIFKIHVVTQILCWNISLFRHFLCNINYIYF